MKDWTRFLGHSTDPEEPYVALENHLQRSIDREAYHSKRIELEAELLLSQEALPGVNLPGASKRKLFILFRELVRAMCPGEIPRKKP